MPFWVCIQTGFDFQTASPNNGYPFPVEAATAPDYLRVLGPFVDMDEYHQAEIMPFNSLPAPKNVAPYGPDTTRGWYAVCPYNVKGEPPAFNPPGEAIKLDYPPGRLQTSAAIGPFATQAQAAQVAQYLECKKVWTPAEDICDPYPKAAAEIDLECSLTCTSLAWPQVSGTIQVSMFSRLCADTGMDPILSKCFPASLLINLGCPPTLFPTLAQCWNGTSEIFDVHMIPPAGYVPNPAEGETEIPPRGYTFRMWGTMCIDSDPNYVNVSLNLAALNHPFDINPVNPPDTPYWGSCGSVGGRIPIVQVQPDKRKNRIYASGLIPFAPNCAGIQSTDCINYAQITVFLIPAKFGCDGTALGGPKTVEGCGLFTNTHAYSCMSVLVEPLTTSPTPLFRSQYAQIGCNAVVASDEHGCFYCTHPGGPANFLCDPTPKFMTAQSIMQTGCDWEGTAYSTQQIQYGHIAGFEVFIKRVAKLNLCVGMRKVGDPTWVVKSFGDIVNMQAAIPYISVVEFPTLNAKLTFYVLEFPSPALAGCIGNDTHPSKRLSYNGNLTSQDFLMHGNGEDDYIIFDDEPFLGLPPTAFDLEPVPVYGSPESPVQPIHHLQIIERLRNPCIHRGEDLEKVADCGCSGQPMRTCSVYGVCRVAGAAWDTRPNMEEKKLIQLCVDCDQWEKATN